MEELSGKFKIAFNMATAHIKKIIISFLISNLPWILAMIAILAIVISITSFFVIDDAGSSSSNTDDMQSVSEDQGGTLEELETTMQDIGLENEDGTIREELLEVVQWILEKKHNLVTGDLKGNNIGGQYNKASCEAVRGTYLGFKGWANSSSTGRSIPISKLGGIVYQCPWWANGRASEVYGRKIQIGGHAKNMYGNAQSAGYSVGQTPKKHSMVVYSGGDYGHVAFVEAVDNKNKCYYISHSGSGKSWFGIQKISFGGAPWKSYSQIGFIYLD